MKSDLPHLKAQLAELNQRIEAARLAEMGDAIARCRAIIDEFELSAFDLGFVRVQSLPSPTRVARTFVPKVVRAPLPPKYRNPATGETWSGRGRKPQWMYSDQCDTFIIRSA